MIRLSKQALGALAIVAWAVIGATGCGGEDFEVQAGTTMLEKPGFARTQFVARANEICRESWADVRQNFASYRSEQDPRLDQRRRASDAIRNSLMSGIDFHVFDGIHLLGTPPAEKSATEDIIGELQEAVERGQRLEPLFSIAEVTELFGDYNERARRYGLGDCLVNDEHLQISL